MSTFTEFKSKLRPREWHEISWRIQVTLFGRGKEMTREIFDGVNAELDRYLRLNPTSSFQEVVNHYSVQVSKEVVNVPQRGFIVAELGGLRIVPDIRTGILRICR